MSGTPPRRAPFCSKVGRIRESISPPQKSKTGKTAKILARRGLLVFQKRIFSKKNSHNPIFLRNIQSSHRAEKKSKVRVTKKHISGKVFHCSTGTYHSS